jgi:hypothetical protein
MQRAVAGRIGCQKPDGSVRWCDAVVSDEGAAARINDGLPAYTSDYALSIGASPANGPHQNPLSPNTVSTLRNIFSLSSNPRSAVPAQLRLCIFARH